MKRTFITLAATLAMIPVAALAHHSFAAEYDGSKPMTLVGVITKVDQQNPHGWFYMSVPSTKPGGKPTDKPTGDSPSDDEEGLKEIRPVTGDSNR